MFNDLRDEQSIIVYNTKSCDDGLLSTAESLYLLNDAEEYDVIAIL